MSELGEIPVPEDFRYRKTLDRGRPRHEKTDPFRIRHPSMDVGKRAKIFAPFDALKGFGDAIAAKNELYEERRALSEEMQQELDRRVHILACLLEESRHTGSALPVISVEYFVPCTDADNGAFGVRGQYRTVTGPCIAADPEITRTLQAGDARIGFQDIYRIGSTERIFDKKP